MASLRRGNVSYTHKFAKIGIRQEGEDESYGSTVLHCAPIQLVLDKPEIKHCYCICIDWNTE